MNSIRRRLTVWLLGGLALLWLGAGIGIYLAVQQSLLKSLDAELALDSRTVRFASFGESDEAAPESLRAPARGARDRLPPYHEEGSNVFFQIWTSSGEEVERSGSLGAMSLPFPDNARSQPTFASTRLADGRNVRTMTFRSSGGSKGKGKGRRGANIAVLAMESAPVDQTLRTLLTGIGIIGLLGALAAVFLVRLSVHRGLQPLTHLGEHVAAIDASRLDTRFPTVGIPVELQPISDRLNQLIQRLEASFERERRFSADLAHEMRTPIAELKTMSEVALKWPDQAGAKTHAETLDIASQLESMVENLLALARWESGELAIKAEPIPLSDFLRQTWEPYASAAAEKHLQITRDLQDRTLETDRSLLQHILTNLFSNAVAYTPDQGTIRIATAEHRIQITNSAPDFRPEDVEHLFDRYWRADTSRTGTSHTGLGLALAKACAEALGFRLSASYHHGELSFVCEETGS